MIGEHSTVTGDRRIAVREAPEWTALFRREAEWTGGDGIYAIPLSGYEGPGRANAGRQVFVFGDTFIGRVDPATGARRDFDMVYNTLAYLDGGQPDAERIEFVWGKTATANYALHKSARTRYSPHRRRRPKARAPAGTGCRTDWPSPTTCT